MTTYATTTDLAARLSASYDVPSNADQLLTKASELIEYATLGRSQLVWDGVYPFDMNLTDRTRWLARNAIQKTMITNATCDQVEYWLEVGEEHDVVGLPAGASLQGGRVQVNKLPGYLGQRALRSLLSAGIYWSGASSI